MWKFLLISIIAAPCSPVQTTPGSCQIALNAKVCKDSSGMLVSVSTTKPVLSLNSTELTAIGPHAFDNQTIAELTIHSTHSLHVAEPAHKASLCRPNVIDLAPQSFSGLSVRSITLACMELGGAQSVFTNITPLRILKLIRNKFTDFPRELCAGISNLKKLRVSEQQMTTLSSSSFLGIAGGLEELRLDGNMLETIGPKSFVSFQHLIGLDLANNQLQVVHQSMLDGLGQLKWLSLANNKIRWIEPSAFANLGSLQGMALMHNLLEGLPDEIFSNLHQLRSLNLNGNRMKWITSRLFQGLNLDVLSLGVSKATHVDPNALRGLPLSTFYLYVDKMTDVDFNAFSALVTEKFVLRINDMNTTRPSVFKQWFVAKWKAEN